MNNEFDDELSRMDELEKKSDSPINKALSLDDPISDLKLRAHPIVQTGTKLQSVISTLPVSYTHLTLPTKRIV